jgi:ABC-2 type transport system permease protein
VTRAGLVGRTPASGPLEASMWPRRQSAAVNLRAIVGRAYPRLIGLSREPSWLFFEILLPFLTTAAFVFVYRALAAPQEYIGFVVLGGAMTAFWLNIVWLMAAQLYWEKDQGNLELYFSAPIDLMSILLGMAVGGLLASSLRAAVVLLVGAWLFGVVFAVEDWLLLFAVFCLTLTALYSLGMVLASAFVLFGREAWHFGQAMIEPVYFVSGLNFPVGRLGLLGGVAISLLPLAVGLDAMRQLSFPASDAHFGTPPPEVEVLILVAMTVVFAAIARWALRTVERKAREQGRLTLKGS